MSEDALMDHAGWSAGMLRSAVLVEDTSGKIVSWSDQAATLLACDPGEFAGKRLDDMGWQHVPGINTAGFTSLVRKKVSSPARSYSCRDLRLKYRYLGISRQVLLSDHKGSQSAILTITELTSLFEEISDRQFESCRNKQLADATFEAIFLSIEGVCIGQNSTAVGLFGFSESEIAGRHCTELFHGDYHDLIIHNIRHGILGPYEAVAVRKDGTTFPCEIQATHKYDLQGRKIRLTAVRDITERKEAEQDLEGEARRREILMAKSGDGIVIINEKHELVEANKRFMEMIGYGENEIYDLHTWDWEARFSKEDIFRSFSDFSSLDKIFETRHRRKDGTEYDVEIRASGANIGSEFLVFAICRDITERKRVEKELIRAKENAEQANHHKSAFLANMSHELRTPLNGIMGMLKLMQLHPMSPEIHEYAANALDASGRLTRLLGDILDLSQVEAGILKITVSEFSIRDTLENVEKLFAAGFREKGIRMGTVVHDGLPATVLGDAMRLQQILTNLVGNALKFTQSGSLTTEVIPLGKQDSRYQRILFKVRDTGIGMDVAKLQSFFEPFVQGENSYSRNFQGAGLGLSICKYLVTLMQGSIDIDSQPGEGTTFYICLPFELPAVTGTSAVTVKDKSVPECPELKILLAEDDRISRLVSTKVLENLGHTVVSVENGEEIFPLLREKESFDVLLLDIQMPEMDGMAVTEKIRSDPDYKQYASVPIIAMTAYAMLGDREIFMGRGMNDYISKPIDPDLLDAALRRAVS